MTPEISEFSYGFALTNELVGWMSIASAPIFPSLIEEGKEGGGYDVKLDVSGLPVFLQFKRAECMVRRNAKPYGDIIASGYNIASPFFRFSLMETWRSRQHEMLVRLSAGANHVFYAAPRFHKCEEINAVWAAGEVARRSIFIPPSSIGTVTDGAAHYVAYDGARAYFCSEPKELAFLSSTDLEAKLHEVLAAEKRPLREVLRATYDDAVAVRDEVEAAFADDMIGQPQIAVGIAAEQPPLPPRIPGRSPKTPPEPLIRDLADIAARDFGAQLVIVQAGE